MAKFETPEIRDYMDKVHLLYKKLISEAEFFGKLTYNDLNDLWKEAHDTIREEHSKNDEA